MKDDSKENELDEAQEKLIQEDQEKRKLEMPVSGRSVFEIQKIKHDRSQTIDKRKK